jgi:hypothetical protein
LCFKDFLVFLTTFFVFFASLSFLCLLLLYSKEALLSDSKLAIFKVANISIVICSGASGYSSVPFINFDVRDSQRVSAVSLYLSPIKVFLS